MAVQQTPRRETVPEVQPRYGPVDWLGGWNSLFWGSALIIVANIFLWFWDYAFNFRFGLDSSSPGFTTHYRSLFWAELIVVGIFAGSWFGWLVRTGRQLEGTQPSPAEETRRIAVLWCIIFPLTVVLAVGAYLWGRWRIPAVYSTNFGFPWSFFLLISATVLEVIQVAFNEWGHSLWLSEEFFATPFHWPFVFYGWLAGGMFAVWGETILRLFEVDKAQEQQAGVAAAGGE
jgi:methane/ammonia monooxygenase subunit C